MTAIQTVMQVQKQFPPSAGWVVKHITVGNGVKVQHPEHGSRMCWLNGHGKGLRVVVKEINPAPAGSPAPVEK